MADSHREPELQRKRSRKVDVRSRQQSSLDKSTELGSSAPSQDWLIGGGEMGDLVRSMDWSATPLGPRHSWPQSLRTTANTVLATPFPMCLLWGEDLTMIYNEGYRIIAADKHPRALGGYSRDIWSEVWEFNKPIFEKVMTRGESVNLEDQVYPITRKGFLEQASFTICYSPVYDESGAVGGTLVTLIESTQRVTARKAAEETLRQRAEEVERLLEAVPAAVWVAHDPQCLTITGNRRANEFYEAQAGENVSATTLPEVRRFFTPDGQELRGEELPMQKAIATNQDVRDVELHVQLPSGKRIAMLGSAVPLRDHAGSARGCIGTFLDITERKRTEEALRQSEARYRVLHESMRDAFVQVTMEGQIVDFNDLYYQMLGYTPDEVRELTYHAITPERWHEFEERIVREQIIARGFSDVYEKEYRRKDGTVFPVELRTILLRDEAGRPVGMWGIVRDITARKAAEAALRESEERFRVAQELSPDGFLIFRPLRDSTGLVTDFLWMYENDAAARMNDTNPKEVCGKRVSEVLAHHDKSPFHKAYKEVAETGEVRVVEEAFYDQDTFQQRRWFRVAAVPATGGDVAILVQDVTERKSTAEARRESEERFRSVAENMSEGLMLFDPRSNLIYQNAASLHIHGYAPQEDGRISHKNLPATWQAWDDQGHPIGFDQWPVSRVFRGERFQDQVLHVLRPETGLEFDASYNGSPIYNAEGKLVFGFITIREITQQRKAEAALRESHARLKKVLEVEAVGVMFWDLATGCMTDANDTFLQMMGYSRREVEARELTWQKLTPPEYLEVSLAEIRKFQVTGRVGPYEKEYFRKDGTRQWLLIAGSSLGDNQCVEFCVDITERKRAEEALRESEERLAAVTENLREGLIIADGEGRVFYWNPAALGMFGYASMEECRRKLAEFADTFEVRPLDDDRPLPVADWPMSRVLRGEVLRDWEIRVRRFDQRWEKILAYSGWLIRSASGETLAFVSVIDVTERKQAEAKLQRDHPALSNYC